MKRRAHGISDRSGMRFPLDEMLYEPGTGHFVHKSESDGKWNSATHPLSQPLPTYTLLDPQPVENARLDVSHVLDLFFLDESGELVLDGHDMPIDAPIFS